MNHHFPHQCRRCGSPGSPGPRRVADKQAAEEVVSKKLKAAASAALAIDGPLAENQRKMTLWMLLIAWVDIPFIS